MSIQRIGVGPRMSKAVVHGDTVYLAGQVADKAAGKSVAEQTAGDSGHHRRAAGRSRHRQDQAADGQHLAVGHVDLRRDERRLGHVGRRRPDAGPRHGRGQAGRAAVHGRDRGHRREVSQSAAGQQTGAAGDGDAGGYPRLFRRAGLATAAACPMSPCSP